MLAYCLGERGLRATAAWAAALGLLVGQLLAAKAPAQMEGRLIGIIDATMVLKAGRAAKRGNGVWRIHSAFELPAERFGQFELTDEHGGEQLDRIAVIPGEIGIADAVHMQPDRVAAVQEQGGDVLVRSGWRNARWLQADGEPFDLLNRFRDAANRVIDCPVWVGRKHGAPLALRLIAVRKPDSAIEAARRKARRQARKAGYQVSQETLAAAEWVILVTSLRGEEYSSEDVLALYRLRWRVELAFKRLKSLIGLGRPPGRDPRSARSFILAHLLLCLLLEPRVDALEDSPRWACAV